MTFQELTAKVNGTVVVDNPNANLNFASASDLLSDVMGRCGEPLAFKTALRRSRRKIQPRN